jgi:hypothetical protein
MSANCAARRPVALDFAAAIHRLGGNWRLILEWLMETFHWEVDLQAPANALELLARDFTVGKVRVSADTAQDRHVLCMDAFDSCADDKQVAALTREILPVISGGLALDLGTAPVLRMGSIRKKHDGGRIDTFIEAETGLLHAQCGTVTAVATVTGPDGQQIVQAQPPAAAVKRAELSLTNPQVAKALRLWATGSGDWTGLYRIWEVIEDAAGGEESTVAAGWTSSNQRTRFKRTANSVKASGDKARHGADSVQPPPIPMSLGEGSAYVENLLRQWLSSLGA